MERISMIRRRSERIYEAGKKVVSGIFCTDTCAVQKKYLLAREIVPVMKIEFAKYHGNGNDFVMIDEMEGEIIPENRKSEFSIKACDRRFGVGADGVIFVQPSKKADARMRILNSDGSEAEMCGNGIRCFALHLILEGHVNSSPVRVETLAGLYEIEFRRSERDYLFTVDMGVPEFDPSKIPVRINGEPLDIEVEGVKLSAVNTGVPHTVVFREDISGDIIQEARKIRYSDLFPEGTNVNFVRHHGDGLLEVRTYERGVEGETMSCGTGSVASASVARRLGLVGDRVRVRTRGGDLTIYFKNGRAYMEGPARRVFNGELSLSAIDFRL